MATYVISDIHGYLSRMFKVLEIAKFDWNNDELYILGDIIDRGPESAEALIWAMEEAPSNIHFLLGNHEDMAYTILSTIQENEISYDFFNNPWSWNGGFYTLQNCLNTRGYKWCHKAADWIKNLPLYYIVDDKLLIHAGLKKDVRLSDDHNSHGRNDFIHIPGIDYDVWAQHLLWVREPWFCDWNSYPYDIIFGHSPTTYDWMSEVNSIYNCNPNYEESIACQGRPGYIVRMVGFKNYKVRYCIDTGRNRMGLLRLDDYSEFYASGD